MQYNEEFRQVVKERFKFGIKTNYLPDQKYINRLIASLDRVEANSYDLSETAFIFEFNDLKENDITQSIRIFVDDCLNQLCWINSIIESGKFAHTEEELDQEFDYKTPTISGNPWTLDKVTRKGVYFRGDEPYQDSRVIINSENIVEIAKSLSQVVELNRDFINFKKNNPTIKSVITAPTTNDSSLFISKDREIDCLNVLKEIKHPILDVDGNFMGDSGMKSAIVAWYYICSRLNLINKNSDNRDVVARKVMKIIPGLKIGGSLFHKDPVAKKYKDDIEQKLKQLARK
jgi:hypothetical protein